MSSIRKQDTRQGRETINLKSEIFYLHPSQRCERISGGWGCASLMKRHDLFCSAGSRSYSPVVLTDDKEADVPVASANRHRLPPGWRVDHHGAFKRRIQAPQNIHAKLYRRPPIGLEAQRPLRRSVNQARNTGGQSAGASSFCACFSKRRSGVARVLPPGRRQVCSAGPVSPGGGHRLVRMLEVRHQAGPLIRKRQGLPLREVSGSL